MDPAAITVAGTWSLAHDLLSPPVPSPLHMESNDLFAQRAVSSGKEVFGASVGRCIGNYVGTLTSCTEYLSYDSYLPRYGRYLIPCYSVLPIVRYQRFGVLAECVVSGRAEYTVPTWTCVIR